VAEGGPAENPVLATRKPLPVKRALITGAGNAGLFLALLLTGQDWDVRVVERSPTLRSSGGAILLWSNATRLLQQAGLLPVLKGEAMPIDQADLRRWDGALLRRIPVAPVAERVGAPTLVVWRGHLIRALVAALGREHIHFSRELPPFSIREDGRVQVQGESEPYDLLVGADGVRSQVRAALFDGSPPRSSGVWAWVGVSPGGVGPLRTAVGVLGRGQRFWRVNMGEQTYWYAITHDKRIQSDDNFSRLRALFRGWEPEVLQILDRADPTERVRFSLVDRPPRRGWSKGPVVLVGDAAHPCTPDLGQGTCQALESAWVLAEELGRTQTLAEALTRYEARRASRTAAITELAWLSLNSSMPLDRLQSGLRDLGIQTAPEWLPAELLRWQLEEGPVSG
jgi:2-polyprenyl-6-methoxyphenol hydroxylase-like FAD-dependent oxidoreductase